MTNFTEANSFDSTVYQIATTDAVLGGPGGIANLQGQSLTNRTRYLLNQITSILSSIATLAGLNSPTFTGSPTVPTPPVGDNTQLIANTAFISNAGNIAAVSVAGNSNVTLTQAQYGFGIVKLTGAITGNIAVIFPNTGKWIVWNATTGAFTITLKTASGSGPTIDRGASVPVYAATAGIQLADSAALQAPNNLSDLDSVSTARSNLGLGTAALNNTGDFDTSGSAAAVQVLLHDLSGVTAPLTARNNLGLGTASVHAATDFDTAGAAAACVQLANQLPVASATSGNGTAIGASYNDTISVTFTAPSNGWVYASGKLNLGGVGTHNVHANLKIGATLIEGDGTPLSQAYHGGKFVSSGASVTVSIVVTTTTDPGAIGTYSVAAFFIPTV